MITIQTMIMMTIMEIIMSEIMMISLFYMIIALKRRIAILNEE